MSERYLDVYKHFSLPLKRVTLVLESAPDGLPCACQLTNSREALDLLLGSTLLVRSGQLRSFLQYACEMELAGKASELSELLIGVEALGKAPRYSTGEDASVRRLALNLRERLNELYRMELATAKLKIELPKESYTPR